MPFANKSEIKFVSEITGSKLWKRSLPEVYMRRYSCLRQIKSRSLEMRGARKTLGKTYRKNRSPSSRLPNNVEVSARQLGEGETQEMKIKSQNFVYDYDEHARSGSSLMLIK